MIDELFDFPFYKWEQKLSNKPFLKQPFGDLWENYTWGEVGIMARKLANGLKSLNLSKNSHIGLVSKNCREWIIADLAISMAGYISVPFFPTLKSNEIQKLLDFGNVDALFVGKLENWEEMKKGVKDDMPIIAFPHYKDHSKVSIRNPLATRPWQHVFEPLSGYLMVAEDLFHNGHVNNTRFKKTRR